jgi:hypothetical protein
LSCTHLSNSLDLLVAANGRAVVLFSGGHLATAVIPAKAGIHSAGSEPERSRLPVHAGAQSGSAAPTCGKPPAFRSMPHASPSSAQAGRLSLPACAEEVVEVERPPERQSLSASQAAEPQVVIDRSPAQIGQAWQWIPAFAGMTCVPEGCRSKWHLAPSAKWARNGASLAV